MLDINEEGLEDHMSVSSASSSSWEDEIGDKNKPLRDVSKFVNKYSKKKISSAELINKSRSKKISKIKLASPLENKKCLKF